MPNDSPKLNEREQAFLDGIQNNTLFDENKELKETFRPIYTKNKAFREAVIASLDAKLTASPPDYLGVMQIINAIAKYEDWEAKAYPFRTINMLINDSFMLLAQKMGLTLASFLPTNTNDEKTNEKNQAIINFLSMTIVEKIKFLADKSARSTYANEYVNDDSAPTVHDSRFTEPERAGLNQIIKTLQERSPKNQTEHFFQVFTSGFRTKLAGAAMSAQVKSSRAAHTANLVHAGTLNDDMSAQVKTSRAAHTANLVHAGTLNDEAFNKLTQENLKALAERIKISNPFVRLLSPIASTQLNLAADNTLKLSTKTNLTVSHKKYLYEVLENLKKDEERSPFSKIRNFFIKLFGGQSFSEKHAEFVEMAKAEVAKNTNYPSTPQRIAQTETASPPPSVQARSDPSAQDQERQRPHQ